MRAFIVLYVHPDAKKQTAKLFTVYSIIQTWIVDFQVGWIFCLMNQVWSLVRRFDQPQKYKPFVSRCVVQGDLRIGSVREVNVKTGLPATTSTERLELFDDDEHVLGIKILDGDHRLRVWAYSLSVCFIASSWPLYISFSLSVGVLWLIPWTEKLSDM